VSGWGKLRPDVTYRDGLLTSVKRNARVYKHRLSGDEIARAYGTIAEELLCMWARKNPLEVVGPYVRDEKFSISVERNHQEADLLFIINQPSGKTIVAFEAKFGAAPIGGEQARFFWRIRNEPWTVVEKAVEGHVVLAKCFRFDPSAREMEFYMGELVVPEREVSG